MGFYGVRRVFLKDKGRPKYYLQGEKMEPGEMEGKKGDK